LKYLPLSILVAIEHSDSSGTTTGFVGKSSDSNAYSYYKRVVLPSGEKVLVLTACAPIKGGEEIMIDVGLHHDLRFLGDFSNGMIIKCNYRKLHYKGLLVPVESLFDLSIHAMGPSDGWSYKEY
jgi:hypothetical protein